jgi:hypothetical protein
LSFDSRPRSIRGQYTYWRQEALSHESCSGIQEKLHLRDLLVHILHELDDEVHQLVLQHLLSVEVGNKERDVIALAGDQQLLQPNVQGSASIYLDRLPPQDKERFRSLRQEPCELVY